MWFQFSNHLVFLLFHIIINENLISDDSPQESDKGPGLVAK
jgi:hypothetical protein